jgi:transcriptional regulator of acetoin/glycerol metabolism
LRGEPLGLEPAAMRLLAEHDWPGNELEFRARLLSAARRAPGTVVRAEDLLATGFAPAPPSSPELSPAPAPVSLTRRPRARRAPRGR